MFQKELNYVQSILSDFFSKIPIRDVEMQWTPTPFSGQWGLSTSFFQAAALEARQKEIKINVPVRAQELAQAVADSLGSESGFERVEAVRGYLNLYFKPAIFAQRVVEEVLSSGDQYGKAASCSKKIMVEYAQLNTHKTFHVGHLRNVILGSVLCNMLDFAGYDVIRANYMGDIGSHVIKWIWNYLKRHKGEIPPANSIRWLGDLYTEADTLSRSDPEAEQEIKTLFARWDARDAEIMALWKLTRQWSLDGFDVMFQRLGARFDKYYFPSEEEDDGKALVADLIARGIAVDGRPAEAVFVDIDKLAGEKGEKYRVLVILRSDGTSLYATTDLPLAIRKFNDYSLEKSIYVVDVRQSLYFNQVFKTLELAGYSWAKHCQHLAYEIVNLPGNLTMSSRDGTVVLLEDLLKEAVDRAVAVVRLKNPELPEEEMQKIGESVALGALKYSMLDRENTKVVTFDWETALNFDGQAAPYIQYAHVRANSILRKVDEAQLPSYMEGQLTLEPAEITLIDLISRFPAEVMKAAEDLKPLTISSYAFKLAQAFNDFYNQCPVIKAKEPERSNRLRLVAAARQTISNSLAILGITAPEAM
jgi:arginyl-tRNA synthetase